MQRDELAKELNCNMRNIIEYRKELEQAGYKIVSTRGKYGGYGLKDDFFFPGQGLDDKQLKALHEAEKYLKSHPDFLPYPDFRKAIDKVVITTSMKTTDMGIYMREQTQQYTDTMKEYIQICENARNEGVAVTLEYKRLNASEFTPIRIHPYEILNDHGNYYCFAYSLKAKDYRSFRFSEERMRNVVLTDDHFNRNPQFKLSNYIGQLSLMKNQTYTLEILLHHASAQLYKEKPQGIVKQMYWIDETTLKVVTVMEGKQQILRFLLAQGAECELIAPQELHEEMEKITKHMMQTYEKRS